METQVSEDDRGPPASDAGQGHLRALLSSERPGQSSFSGGQSSEIATHRSSLCFHSH